MAKAKSTKTSAVPESGKYDGRKDEYGGKMTGTGYGRQAKRKKQKSVDLEDTSGEFNDNKKSAGFNEGLGQGSGYGKKNS